MSTTREIREITVFATQGQQLKKIETDVATWGELKPLLRAEGFNVDSMLATENVTKTDLVNDLAVLPGGPFRIFLRSEKPKSGSMSRADLFSAMKQEIKRDPSLKDYFNSDGQNMTRLKTSTLQALWENHCRSQRGAEIVVPTEILENPAEACVPKEILAAIEQDTENVPAEVLEADSCVEKEGNTIPSFYSEIDTRTKSLEGQLNFMIDLLKENFDKTDLRKEAVKSLKKLREEVLEEEKKSLRKEAQKLGIV